MSGSAGSSSAPGPAPIRTTPGTPAPIPSRPANEATNPGIPLLMDAGATSSAGSPPNDAPIPPDAGSAPDTPVVEDPACQGLGLLFDGTNYVAIPRGVIQDDFTLEAWIQTSSSLAGTSGFYGRGLFDADVSGMGNNDDFSVTILNDRLALGLGNPDTTVQGITVVTTGNWVHVAVTRRRTNGQLQLLVNGALDAVAVAPNRNALAGLMTIRLAGGSLVRNFIGSIDEVKLWNVVRSAEQVASDMHSRPTGTEEGLVGYYSFEDAGIEQTADGSSLGAAAPLIGSPSYVPSSALCAQPL